MRRYTRRNEVTCAILVIVTFYNKMLYKGTAEFLNPMRKDHTALIFYRYIEMTEHGPRNGKYGSATARHLPPELSERIQRNLVTKNN